MWNAGILAGMRGLEIRRMMNHEVEPTVAMWARSRWDALRWLEERMGHSPQDDLDFFRGTLMPENEILVAIEGQEIVGLIAIGTESIEQLFVEPTAQGRGIGTALLQRAMTLRPTGLRLYTHQRNARARSFYERRGFDAVAFGVSPPPEEEPDVEYRWKGEGRSAD
jgi:putative acetyltransferase